MATFLQKHPVFIQKALFSAVFYHSDTLADASVTLATASDILATTSDNLAKASDTPATSSDKLAKASGNPAIFTLS
jgi:hypothetical protein